MSEVSEFRNVVCKQCYIDAENDSIRDYFNMLFHVLFNPRANANPDLVSDARVQRFIYYTRKRAEEEIGTKQFEHLHHVTMVEVRRWVNKLNEKVTRGADYTTLLQKYRERIARDITNALNCLLPEPRRRLCDLHES